MGAAVGEVVLGKKAGNRAMFWGGVAGTIPDLDIALNPFLNAVDQVTLHRGFSHSLLFALLLAPILGFAISKAYKGKYAGTREWTILAFLATVTHPLLDYFTTYGTQLFSPLSGYPAAFSSISVIDPIFTAPLFASVVAVAFLKRASRKRHVVAIAGLSIACLYLALTIVNKIYVTSVFENELRRQGITYSRIFTLPTPLNNVLWRAAAESENVYWEGYYSLLDDGNSVTFRPIPKNHHIIEPFKNRTPIQRLLRFSHGFYSAAIEDDMIIFNEVRYGRAGGWTNPEADFIFSFKFPMPTNGNDNLRIERNPPAFKITTGTWQKLLDRIQGREFIMDRGS